MMIYLPTGKDRLPIKSSCRSLPRYGKSRNNSNFSLKTCINLLAAFGLFGEIYSQIPIKSSRAGSEMTNLKRD